VALAGTPFLLVDTAGLRDSVDEVEAVGIERARESLVGADLVLWLGSPAECPIPDRAIRVATKADLRKPGDRVDADIQVSAETGQGIEDLIQLVVERARALLPQEGEVAINARHRTALAETVQSLRRAASTGDPLVAAELLRLARQSLDSITGRVGVEDMLDRLFGAFCIGK
jgi:tRNA modification GTPase